MPAVTPHRAQLLSAYAVLVRFLQAVQYCSAIIDFLRLAKRCDGSQVAVLTWPPTAHGGRRRLAQQLTALSNTNSGIAETGDGRQEVENSDAIPYNMIGPVVAAVSDTQLVGCTGALIATDVVLTAAHCLQQLDSGVEIRSAQFAPGFNSKQDPHAPAGVANMVDYKIAAGFRECGAGGYSECHRQHDFGVIRLDAAFDSWMDFGFDDQSPGSDVINTAGYPGDLDNCFDLQADSQCSLYHVSCDDDAVGSGSAYVTGSCFAFNGQSGSPMWLFFSDTQDRQIRGVLAAKLEGVVGSSFTLITEAVYDEIQDYINDWHPDDS